MRLLLTADKNQVRFIQDDIKEYQALHSFPGMLKDASGFFIWSKPHIVYNIYQRVKKVFKKVAVSEEVMQIIQQDMKLKPLPDDFKFITTPKDFQEIALRYLYTVGNGGLLLAPGMGKSKVVLDYIKLMKFKRSIIVCPRPLLFVWEDEVATHRDDLSIFVLPDVCKDTIKEKVTDSEGKTKTKYRQQVNYKRYWEEVTPQIMASDITVVNYNKAVTFKAELSNLGFEFIHLDEFLIKDPSTDRTKELTKLSKTIPYRCGGSGTLVNNTILDIFAPVRYLEPSLVGESFYDFQTRYTEFFSPRKGLKIPTGFKNMDEARAILESCCIVMSKEKWLKLPAKNFKYLLVQPSDRQRELYHDLSRNYIAKIGDEEGFIEVDNALVMMSKLYQISNGFLYKKHEHEDLLYMAGGGTEEETKPKKASKTDRETFYLPCSKIDRLNQLLDNELKGKKAIIWFNMEAEYTLIQDLLEARGDDFLTIKGGEKDSGAKVRKFNKTPGIRWLVCQAKSVNYGITVLGTKQEDLDVEALPDIDSQVADEVFFSLNFSLEVFLQQQDRIHRLGQDRECNYYILLTNLPIERRIKHLIENKITIRESMLVDIAEKLETETEIEE